MAAITGGIYTHIDDGDGNLATAMSSFYLYYAYGLQTEEVTVSTPFISFSSGKLTVTLSKPVYVDNSFVGKSPPPPPPSLLPPTQHTLTHYSGVVGTDVPLDELLAAVGDVTIG